MMGDPGLDLDLGLDRLLTVREVAAYRRTSVGVLAQERCSGRGPRYIKASGRILYPRADLVAWLEARAVVPGGGAV